MSIELDTGTTREKTPSLKTGNVGDAIVGRIIDLADIDVRDYATGETETWDDGKPKKQKAITLLVDTWEGDATARHDSADLPLEAGMIGTIFTGVRGYYEFREGVDQYDGKVTVGTIVRWSLDSTSPAKTKGFNDAKHRSYTLTANTDTASVEEAEAAHRDRNQAPPIELDNDEDPF